MQLSRGLASALIVVGVLGCAGCSRSDNPPGVVSPEPTRSTLGDALDCTLVDVTGPTVDQRGATGATALAAVEQLAEDLGLRGATAQQWPDPNASSAEGADSSAGADPSQVTQTRWLLFTSDGRGYGVAVAERTENGWVASVAQLCASMVPLPNAHSPSGTPSVGPP